MEQRGVFKPMKEPMPEQDLSEEETVLYQLVPSDGSTIGNYRAQSLSGWPRETYWRARDALVDKGLVTRGRGRGGTLRRIVQTVPTGVVTVPVDIANEPDPAAYVKSVIRREQELYDPLVAVLRTDWAHDHRARPISVETVARQGRRLTGGTWSRPDIVSVEIKNLLYIPTKTLEVITFEVKPSDAIDVQVVYEALAHRSASTHAYVMLHVPSAQAASLGENVRRVQTVARSHRVGVITFANAEEYNTWDELEEAERVEPDPERLNQFIETQLPDWVKDQIARDLR